MAASLNLCAIHPTLPPLPTHYRVSGLAVGAGFALAGALLGQLSQPNQEGPPCTTCNGAGYIDCLCQRWLSSSVRSAGCDSCRGSLKTRCPSCRGGGTAIPSMVPIPVRIRDGVKGLFSVVGLVGLGNFGAAGGGRARRRVDAFVSTTVALAGRDRRRLVFA